MNSPSAYALPAVYTRTHSVGGLIPKFNIPVLDLASFNGFSLFRRQILHLFGFQSPAPVFVDTKPCNTVY